MQLSAAQGSAGCIRGVWVRTASVCDISVQYIRSRCLLHLKPTSKPPKSSCQSHRERENPCCVKCYLSPHLPFLSCTYLSLPLCIRSLFFLQPSSLPVSFNCLSLFIYHSLYLCLLALCVCIDFVAVHTPCFSPFLIEGVRWSLRLPNESLFFSALTLFSLAPPKQARTPSALNSCVCEMSSLCSDCQPISVQAPHPLFSGPLPSFFSPPKFTSLWRFSLVWRPKMNTIPTVFYHTGMFIFSAVFRLSCMFTEPDILFLGSLS